MKAIVVTDQARLASLEGANYGDVVVEVHASGFTGNELEWPSTWIDRLGRDRTPSIPGHEVAGVVTSRSYGTTGLSVGQRVFGLTDWTRDGTLEDVGGVDLVFDVLGGDIQKRSAAVVRAGGTLVTVTGPPEAWPADGLAIDFVVTSDRAQLSEIAPRVRDGRLRTNIGTVAALDDAVAAFNPTERIKGKTIIRSTPRQ